MADPEIAISCTSQEPCVHAEECRRANLCLGSDEGVAYQERHMKAFFEWLFEDQPNAE